MYIRGKIVMNKQNTEKISPSEEASPANIAKSSGDSGGSGDTTARKNSPTQKASKDNASNQHINGDKPLATADNNYTEEEMSSDLPESSRSMTVAETDLNGGISPNAELAEQMMLGMLMLGHEVWDSMNIQLDVSDFFNAKHRHIYEVAKSLYNKNKTVDTITVIEELGLAGELEKAGGKEYISELAAAATWGENINDYTALIYDRALRRKFISLTKRMATSAEGARHDSIQNVLQEAEQDIFSLGDKSESSTNRIAKVGDKIHDVINQIDYYHKHPGQLTGQGTGFSMLDDKTAGLQKSDFIVLAGRPSMGKTSFALNMAATIAVNDNKAVLVFSLEMPTSMLVMRLISILGSVNLANVRSGKLSDNDWNGIRQAGEMLSDAPIYIDDSLDLTPTTIRSRIRRVKRMLPEGVELALVVVDYIQLMNLVHTNENRVNEIAEISRSLKNTAKEFDIPMLALSQLNRGVESRDNKRPNMSDLRDSGAIEQDADLILFIYRDEVYNKDNADSKGKAEIILAKHRNGPTGTVYLSFQAGNASFANLDMNDYKDMQVGEDISDIE